MDERYKLELRDREPDTVTELNLDNCKATEISGINDKLTSLDHLSMINTGLTSLKGLPKLPKLTRLDISDNQLADGFEVIAESCPDLLHLNLGNNKITDFKALEALKATKIASIDLFANPISNPADGADEPEAAGYRAKIFEMIPTLQYLDGADVDNEEIPMSEFDGEDEDGNEGDDSDDEGSEVSLSKLNDSQFCQDEDETEDFEAGEDGKPTSEEAVERRGQKRKAEEEAEGSEAKKEA